MRSLLHSAKEGCQMIDIFKLFYSLANVELLIIYV